MWDKKYRCDGITITLGYLEIRSTPFIVYTKTRTLTQTMQPNESKILIKTAQINIKVLHIPLWRKNDKFIDAKCRWSLLCCGGFGRLLSPVPRAAPLSRAARRLVNARQAGIHQKAADWRELWPRDASIWKTRQRPLPLSSLPLPSPPCLYSSPPVSVCLVSRGSPSLPPRTHTEPAVRVGWLTGTTGCWTSQASFQKCDRKAAGPPTAGEDMRVGLPHHHMDFICWTFKFYLDWFRPGVLKYKAQRATVTKTFSSMNQMSIYWGWSGHMW